jgi:hypothetical protein
MGIATPPDIAVDVCIDAGGHVDLVLWDDTRTFSQYVGTTLSGDSFSATGIDLSALFPAWTTVTVDVTGTVSGDGTQMTVAVTGTASTGYTNATVDANFTIARNDALVCSMPAPS